MMNFKYDTIPIPVSMENGKECSDAYVWSRDSGNLVIVVIDDDWGWCRHSSSKVPSRKEIYPLLKEGACALPELQAIGFFPLAAGTDAAHKVLKYIQNWLHKIRKQETSIYFLVDVRSTNDSMPKFDPEIAYESTIKWLEKARYPFRNLTWSGSVNHPLNPQIDFQKGPEAEFIKNNCKKFSPKLMKFLGIGLHKDKIIDDAIQFYAKPWAARWDPEGWYHDELEKKCSDHSRALAGWLGIDFNNLCNWEDGQSAKSLMIWVGSGLWGSDRPIQGNVLKAAMKKLEIPLSETSPISDEALIDMPCTPCLPFLVSLRNFLLCCKEKGAPVSEIRFIQNAENYTFRLMMELDNPEKFEKRFRETHCKHKKSPPVEHTFTRPLIYLIYCMTEGLPKNMRRDYIPLFTAGKEEQVVKVEVTSDCINLIWKRRTGC